MTVNKWVARLTLTVGWILTLGLLGGLMAWAVHRQSGSAEFIVGTAIVVLLAWWVMTVPFRRNSPN